MPKPDVFNLMWYSEESGGIHNPAPAARGKNITNTLSKQQPIAAVILYPALTTPAILCRSADNLEVLLLTKGEHPEKILRSRIREQLKIAKDLAAKRRPTDPPASRRSVPPNIASHNPVRRSCGFVACACRCGCIARA